jgi:hypothetical protein
MMAELLGQSGFGWAKLAKAKIRAKIDRQRQGVVPFSR